ncbi:MAG: hypothetical protein V8T87_08300 [Victivallales bacterium]
MKYFFRYGGKLRRITYVLNDGIALRFPGMYEEVSSPEDFLCEEYRSQPQPHRLTWTSTYLDSSDHLVAACWRPFWINAAGKSEQWDLKSVFMN